jgi:rhomboid-like protein
MFVLSLASPWVNQNFALFNIGSDFFQPYQIVTHFFMHGNVMHIFFNMFGLVMFGSLLEKRWGAKRFLFFYLFTAIGAFLCQVGINYYQYFEFFNGFSAQEMTYFAEQAELIEFNESYPVPIIEYYKYHYVPMVGASGAIMGLLAAFAYLFPNTELMMMFIPIPIKAKYMIPVYMLIELTLGVGNFEWDNIAHFAHLGGALFGIILVLIWKRDRSNFY